MSRKVQRNKIIGIFIELNTHIYIFYQVSFPTESSEEFGLQVGLAVHEHQAAPILQLEPLPDHGNSRPQNSRKARHGGYRSSAVVGDPGQEVEGEAVGVVEVADQ